MYFMYFIYFFILFLFFIFYFLFYFYFFIFNFIFIFFIFYFLFYFNFNVASKRDSLNSSSGGSDGPGGRLLALLLTEMDGIFGNGSRQAASLESRVIIIGTTSLPDQLDPAITRPGRLDTIINIPMPGTQARKGAVIVVNFLPCEFHIYFPSLILFRDLRPQAQEASSPRYGGHRGGF